MAIQYSTTHRNNNWIAYDRSVGLKRGAARRLFEEAIEALDVLFTDIDPVLLRSRVWSGAAILLQGWRETGHVSKHAMRRFITRIASSIEDRAA
jgi:hypothetical protein